jgi:hypothetical protein
LFDIFISKKKLELETTLQREIYLAALSIILNTYLTNQESEFHKSLSLKAIEVWIINRDDVCTALRFNKSELLFYFFISGSVDYGLRSHEEFGALFLSRCKKALTQELPPS